MIPTYDKVDLILHVCRSGQCKGKYLVNEFNVVLGF